MTIAYVVASLVILMFVGGVGFELYLLFKELSERKKGNSAAIDTISSVERTDRWGRLLYWTTFGLEIVLGFPRSILIFTVVSVVSFLIAGFLFIPLGIVAFFAIHTFSGFLTFAKLYTAFWAISDLAVSVYLCYYCAYASLTAKRGSVAGDERTAWSLGARPPSRREQERLDDVLFQLAHSGHQAVEFHHADWWVIDSQRPESYTIGRSLYLTSAVFKDDFEYLAALIVREIGKLNNGDGKYLKALRCFVFPFVQEHLTTHGRLTRANAELSLTNIKLGFYFGGLGVMIMSQFWAEWFRERDYLADQYAAELGYGDDLVKYLESIEDLSTAAPFSTSWVQYTELRIDRLLGFTGVYS